MLCVKDPALTPHFPNVVRIPGARVRFVTVIRHPYDVVRSRQDVADREGKGSTRPPPMPSPWNT